MKLLPPAKSDSDAKPRLPVLIKIALGLVLLAGGIAAWRIWFPDLDREQIIAAAKGLPAAAFLALFVILPLLGVPISIFLVVAGLKYGVAGGMVAATAATAVHNAAAFAATKTWLQHRVERLLERLNYSIPQIPAHHQAWFTAVFAAVPGPPYTIKLYSLALTNISFQNYFWIGWPVYAASCIIYVGLGDAAASLDGVTLAALVAAALLLMFIISRFIKEPAFLRSEGAD